MLTSYRREVRSSCRRSCRSAQKPPRFAPGPGTHRRHRALVRSRARRPRRGWRSAVICAICGARCGLWPGFCETNPIRQNSSRGNGIRPDSSGPFRGRPGRPAAAIRRCPSLATLVSVAIWQSVAVCGSPVAVSGAVPPVLRLRRQSAQICAICGSRRGPWPGFCETNPIRHKALSNGGLRRGPQPTRSAVLPAVPEADPRQSVLSIACYPRVRRDLAIRGDLWFTRRRQWCRSPRPSPSPSICANLRHLRIPPWSFAGLLRNEPNPSQHAAK
jgi:hypothetical protein